MLPAKADSIDAFSARIGADSAGVPSDGNDANENFISTLSRSSFSGSIETRALISDDDDEDNGDDDSATNLDDDGEENVHGCDGGSDQDSAKQDPTSNSDEARIAIAASTESSKTRNAQPLLKEKRRRKKARNNARNDTKKAVGTYETLKEKKAQKES